MVEVKIFLVNIYVEGIVLEKILKLDLKLLFDEDFLDD